MLLRALIATLLLGTFAAADTIRVSAAISLKDALEEVAKAYQAETGEKVTFNFGSSGQLAAQIASGADVDVFISAAQKQVDDLNKQGLLSGETRKVIAGNVLVLIVPADAKDPPSSFEALAGPSVKRVAIGEPKSVPAGQYATQVLKHFALDEKLKDRVVYGTNVRQVLAYVERGEVSAGIVYASDAKESGDKVKVVATAQGDWHEPIVYPAVVVKASAKQEAAKRFIDYLASEKARAVLTAKGFASARRATAPEPRS
ncbi:MAG TPA: molybdate ABC transporter substrate-binding protein [Tepidisphaeraceae bacterium]|jgi:molybdate transport system substrate-binding protein